MTGRSPRGPAEIRVGDRVGAWPGVGVRGWGGWWRGDEVGDLGNVGAGPGSGSFKTEGGQTDEERYANIRIWNAARSVTS